jgi:flagellar protein FliL
MADDEGERPAEEAPKRAGGGGKLIPIILVLNTGLMGALFFFVMKKPAAPAAGAAAPAAAAEKGEGHGGGEKEEGGGEHGPPGSHLKPGPILKLENFVIQLKTADTDRYVRLAFDVEVSNEADKQVVTDYLSHIRDVVISYFADRTLDELRGSEAMERTKEALMKRIDDVVPGRRLKNLYITDFIVQ